MKLVINIYEVQYLRRTAFLLRFSVFLFTSLNGAICIFVNFLKRLGNQVGYQIRMEAKRSKNTRLLFCTTGVILRRLQDDRDLKSITHVIVDEVHERQVQTDVLLIALRQLLRTTRRDLKVILVSACFCCISAS